MTSRVATRTGAGQERQELARLGEEMAADFFRRAGAAVIGRNWRAGKLGELDLVVREPDGTLVVVEVKTRRRTGDYHSAYDTIGWRKQQKIVTSARIFASLRAGPDCPCRLDVVVVEITGSGPDRRCELIHIPGAFEL